MSVRDAYINHWSYFEDKELWRLENLVPDEYRALLPAWKPILLLAAPLLQSSYVEDLIDVSLVPFKKFAHQFWRDNDTYFKHCVYPSYPFKRNYNPFMSDLKFICYFAGEANTPEQKHKELVTVIGPLIKQLGLSVLRDLFISLASTKSDPALDLLEEYMFQPQSDLLGAGPDGGVITYSMIIYSLLRFIGTERALSIRNNYSNREGFNQSRLSLQGYQGEDGMEVMVEVMGDLPFEDDKKISSDADKSVSELREIMGFWKVRSLKPFCYTEYDLITVKKAHALLKPQGYNPTLKRLGR